MKEIKKKMRLAVLVQESLKIIRETLSLHGDNVRFSDSGGIDSVVLKHLAKRAGVKRGIFVNTGVEEKLNLKFMKSKKADNDTEWLTPSMSFKKSCYKYGFPIGTKETAKQVSELTLILKNVTPKNIELCYKRVTGFNRLGINSSEVKSKFSLPLWGFEALYYKIPLTAQCCNVLKKDPIKRAKVYSLTGEMKSESLLRKTAISKAGAIGKNKATPLANWSKVDIWDYVLHYKLDYSLYYFGEDTNNPTIRSGCTHCYMGLQYENKVNKGVALKYPKQHSKVMAYKHKDGMTFDEAVELMERIYQKPNRLLQHQERVKLIDILESHLIEFGIKYNPAPLEELKDHSLRQIKKRLI